MNSIHDCYTLKNGVKIPCIAFGTYKAAEDQTEDVLLAAMETGYRYFDTASFYSSEEYLGKAVKRSGIPREELFLSSKLWKEEMGYENVRPALEQTLRRLGTDYLDLYMIHWPLPTPDYADWKTLDRETWRAMEELYREGKIRAIGLSNFLPHHIENILSTCETAPMTNQLEIHPGYSQEAAVRYCQEHQIQMQAWSPMGRQRMAEDVLMQELAEKYQVSQAQICLRYELQKNIIPMPKSASRERMKENMEIFHFSISQEDMYRLDTMPQTGWSGEHPDRVRVRF